MQFAFGSRRLRLGEIRQDSMRLLLIWNRAHRPFWLLAGMICLAILASCGYRVASNNRLESFRTVAVLPLENRTTTFKVEQYLTRALIQEFIESSGFEVVNSASRGDAVLRGIVNGISVNPVTFGRTSFGSTFLVTLRLSVELTDTRNQQVLFRNNNFIFREQYVINVDLENFFTELNPALDRIARDFAASVVTTIREDF